MPGDTVPGDPVAAAVETILAENHQARAELFEAVDGLDDEQIAEGWFGPGSWAVRDIVAHLYEWQNGYAHGLERMARGERPEIPDYDPGQPDDVFNALVVERNRALSWEELIVHVRAAEVRHEAAVKNLVGRIPPDRFEEGRTARRFADTAEHDREHTPAIVEWRRTRGI